LICSQAHNETYKPMSKAWRSSTDGWAGPPRSKRRWSSQTNGKAVPVAAVVKKAKNNQRGPMVGRAALTSRINPIHPTAASSAAATIRLR